MQKHQGTITPTSYLREYDRDLITVERKLEELTKVRDALRSAREAMASVILDGATAPRSHNGNNGDSRAPVVKEILEARGEPVDVDHILKELERRNMSAPRGSVAATLSYLKRTGAISNPERGRWVAVKQAA